MDTHFHVWTRSGRVFRLHDKPYASRSHAAKVAVRLRPDKADRMVRECEQCPCSQRSKRQQIRWNQVADALAVKFGADRVTVRAALRDAIGAERDRK